MTDILKRSTIIGEGSFAVIHRLYHNESKKYVVFKRLKINDQIQFSLSSLAAEICALKKLTHHNNVPKIYTDLNQQACNHHNGGKIPMFAGHSGIFMEYCPSETLTQVMTSRKRPFNSHEFKIIMAQLFSAIKYAHSECIAHHDIKPDNILIDVATNQIKLIDWGLAIFTKSKNELVNVQSGTPLYLPLEVLIRKPYNPFKADYWSLGVTLYELAFYNIPFCHDEYEGLVRLIATTNVQYPLDTPFYMYQVLFNLLQKAPKKRKIIY